MPKSYPPEFKARVLALLKAGRSIRQVALELELSEATIYTWRKQDEIDSGARPGLSSPQAAELAAARRRIRELEEEVLILNKAAERWKPVVPPKDRFALIGERVAVQWLVLSPGDGVGRPAPRWPGRSEWVRGCGRGR